MLISNEQQIQGGTGDFNCARVQENIGRCLGKRTTNQANPPMKLIQMIESI